MASSPPSLNHIESLKLLLVKTEKEVVSTVVYPINLYSWSLSHEIEGAGGDGDGDGDLVCLVIAVEKLGYKDLNWETVIYDIKRDGVFKVSSSELLSESEEVRRAVLKPICKAMDISVHHITAMSNGIVAYCRTVVGERERRPTITLKLLQKMALPPLPMMGLQETGGDSIRSAAPAIGALERLKLLMNCNVCLDDTVSGGSLLRLPCSHLFHEICIVRRLRRPSNCPTRDFPMPRLPQNAATLADSPK